MLFAFDVYAVPNLKGFAYFVEILQSLASPLLHFVLVSHSLFKAIQLYYSVIFRHYFQLMAFRGRAPLCCGDLFAIECERLAPATGFPSQTTFCESASAVSF